MKEIIKYIAEDGTEFYESDKCRLYEKTIENVKTIMSQIEARPENDNSQFVNGYGYIQHNKDTLLNTRNELLYLIMKENNHPWFKQTIDKGWNAHSSYAGRIIDEMNIKAFNSAWYRFMCIDEKGREWGQPFFANNPNQAPYQKNYKTYKETIK